MVRVLKAILICSVLSSGAFLVCVLLGVPGFADEREGWIGIPSSLGYSVGTRSGNMVVGSVLYAIYGAAAGLLIGLAWCAARPRKGR